MPGTVKRVEFVAGILLFVAVFLILYITLFPFDFISVKGMTLKGAFERFDLHFNRSYLVGDFPGNILLFIPFGFALAASISGWRPPDKTAIAVILAAGLLFSTGVEILQICLLRFSSFVDVLANVLGAILGGLIFKRWGDLFREKVEQLWEKIRQRSSVSNLTALFLLYAALVLVVPLVLARASVLHSWDPSFPLILGNERTGDRPWQGEIAEVYLTDQALSAEEINTIFSAGDLSGLAREKLLADYRLDGRENLSDQAGNLPDLRWHNGPLETQGQNGVRITSLNWLETQAPVSFLTERIRLSSQFTLGIVFASSNIYQSGPARILSISTDPYLRNLTVGQEGPDLIFRFRTSITGENGRKPELVLPGFFTGNGFHHLIASYDGSTLRLYRDGRLEPYIYPLKPEVVLFWVFPPSGIGQVRLNAFQPLVYELLFYGLAFAPLGCLLILVLRIGYASRI